MLRKMLTLSCCHQRLSKEALPKAKIWSAGNPLPCAEGFGLRLCVRGLKYKFIIGELGAA